MKKILVILNGIGISQHVTDAAIQIAQNGGAILHPVIMNASLLHEEFNYLFPNDLSLAQNSVTGKSLIEEDLELIATDIKIFAQACDNANVKTNLETEQNVTLAKLIELSAFADLILADAAEDLKEHHIIDLLTGAHCPVYLVAKNVKKVENVILTYDGSFSSIYAIRQYTQVFPELKDLPTRLVHITSDDSEEFPREKNIKSWLPGHYNNLEYKILHGNVREEMVAYVHSVTAPLVVMGSFGRSSLSRMFHKSLANAIIADGKSALFITHE